MSASKKEYDPLSGLFGGGPGVPSPDAGNDPFSGSPADAPEPGLARVVRKPFGAFARPPDRVTAASSPPAASSPADASPPAAPPAASGPDPRQLARILAKAAAARAAAPASAAASPKAAVDPVKAPAPTASPAKASAPGATTLAGRAIPGPVRRLSAEEALQAAPAAVPPVAAPSSGSPGRVVASPKAPRSAAPPPAAAAAPPPAAAAPAPVAPRAAAPAGRLGALAAPPPKRTLSAAEALESARAAEAAARVAPAPASFAPAPAPVAPAPAPVAPAAAPVAPAPAPVAGPPPPVEDDQLTERAQPLVNAALPGAPLYVACALRADERAVLLPLWKAHRARLLAGSDVRTAFAAAAVVQALGAVPLGALIAANVVRDGGDHLVWIDLRDGRVLAAFDGAAAWGMSL